MECSYGFLKMFNYYKLKEVFYSARAMRYYADETSAAEIIIWKSCSGNFSDKSGQTYAEMFEMSNRQFPPFL